MAVAKVIEICASSKESFEEAIRTGIKRASDTINDVQGAWIKEQKICLENGEISEFRVNMMVSFLLKDG